MEGSDQHSSLLTPFWPFLSVPGVIGYDDNPFISFYNLHALIPEKSYFVFVGCVVAGVAASCVVTGCCIVVASCVAVGCCCC